MTSIGFSIASQDDPESGLAGIAVARLFRDRQFDRYRAWLDTKANYPASWRAAAFDSEYLFYITPEEPRQLNHQLPPRLSDSSNPDQHS